MRRVRREKRSGRRMMMMTGVGKKRGEEKEDNKWVLFWGCHRMRVKEAAAIGLASEGGGSVSLPPFPPQAPLRPDPAAERSRCGASTVNALLQSGHIEIDIYIYTNTYISPGTAERSDETELAKVGAPASPHAAPRRQRSARSALRSADERCSRQRLCGCLCRLPTADDTAAGD